MARARKITFELDAENQRLKKKLREADAALDKSKKKASGFKKLMTSAFTGIAAGVTVAIVAFKKMFTTLSDFDAGMRNVNSILGLSEEKFKSLKTEVLGVQDELGISSKELTEALYQAVSAGIAAGDAIAFLKTAGKVGIAGVASTTEAVDVLTTILNAFHLEASETDRVADILFQTIKLGKTDLAQLSASFAQVAPIAAANGIAFEQIAAAVASLTKQGTPTAQAMTQIRASIIGMNKVLGDGWSATMSYQEAVALVAEKAGGSNNKLKEMLGRVEGVNAVLGLTGENAATAASDLDAMTNSLGAAGDAFDEQSKGIQRRLDVFISGIVAGFTKAADAMFDFLLPAEKTQTAIQKVTEAGEKQRKDFRLLAAQYRILRDQTTRTKTEQSRYLEIIEDLETIYPNYIKNIDLENDSRSETETALIDAGVALDDYVAKQVRAAVIQAKQKEIVEAAAKIAELEVQRISSLAQLADAGILSPEQRAATIEAFENVHTIVVEQIKEEREKLKKELEISQKVLSDIYGDILSPGGAGGGSEGKSQREKDAIDEFHRIGQAAKAMAEEITEEHIRLADIEKELNAELDEDDQEFLEAEIERMKIKGKEFEKMIKKLEKDAAKFEDVGRAIGSSIVSGFDDDGFRGALRSVLRTLLDFLNNYILGAYALSLAKAGIGDFTAIAKVAAATVALQSFKAGLTNFRQGVEGFRGNQFVAHEGEFVDTSTNVHTKSETEKLFDLTEVVTAIKEQTNILNLMIRRETIIRGKDIYLAYEKHKRTTF